ncbi:MAG TPA: hypothetical protein VIJ68_04750 [Candidatus Saccharimonadales bacterium]
MKNTSYVFHSTWKLAAPKAAVWQALAAQPFSWDAWWPQLSDVRDMRYIKGLSGTSFSCTWWAPTGYRLKSDVAIGKVVSDQEVILHADGDLRGSVSCRLSESNGQTKIDIDWRVETTKPWMNRLAFALRPIFVWSHHAVMRSGERGLHRHLAAKPVA